MSHGYEFSEFMQRWPDTRRSMVEKLHGSSSPEAARCWTDFVAAYTKPMLEHMQGFLRMRGWRKAARHEAEEIVQAFTVQRVDDGRLASQDPETPFRLCLVRLLENFSVDRWRKQHTQRRHPNSAILSLDSSEAVHEHEHDPPLNDWGRISMRHIVQSALLELARGRNAGVYWLIIRAVTSQHPRAHLALCAMLDMDWEVYGRRRLRACMRFAEHLMAGLGEGLGSEESWPAERATLDQYLKLHLPGHFPPHDPENPDFPPQAKGVDS